MLARRVEPEDLDFLEAGDPRAIRSRGDLRRVNRVMRNLATIDWLIRRAGKDRPARIVELGAGDGSLLLGLARRHAVAWPGVKLTFVDKQDLLDEATRAEYVRRGWSVEVVATDVFAWLRIDGHLHYDLILANLFMHHFEGDRLSQLLAGIAKLCGCFIACEPRRAYSALLATHLIWAIGANSVTRRDAVLSVHAGFRDQELSSFWPKEHGWRLLEQPAKFFAHSFLAVREVTP